MIIKFEMVPNPGFSRKGIHASKTTALIAKVDQPIEIRAWRDIPCANTDHGPLPMLLWMTNASPKPKILKPTNNINTLNGFKSQRPLALHGTCGIVLCGRKNSMKALVDTGRA